MATIYDGRQAAITKAADLLRLSVRLPEAAKQFLDYTAGDPQLASAATQLVAAANKSCRYCLKCGAKMKAKRADCKKCGAKAHIIDRPERGKPMYKIKPKRAKKALKARRAMVTKAAYSAAAGAPVKSRGEALNAMWQAKLTSADPGERELAWQFLYGRR